jgi:hypothetical protein
MADAELSTPLHAAPLPLPDPIHVDLSQPLRFTPKQLRELKAQTGRAFTELFADDPFTTTAWLRLRREGWPNLRYADLEDCVIEAGAQSVAVDPLNGTPPTASPPSVGSGG